LTNKYRWFCDASNRQKNVLSEDSQKMFLGKEFVSFEFKDLSPEQEEDLFARVQMGVQLSPAEKMRASSGPWQELAKLFVEDFPEVYSLLKDRARAKDFQLTLSCFSQVLEVMHPTAADGNPILKTSLHALPKLLSNKDALDDGIKSHLASIWNIFKDLLSHDEDTFTNANKYLRGVQTFAPMEMVAVMVLISMYSKTRNKELLLGDIQTMREAIRENFADIRMNSQLWKFVWKFLEDLEAIRGAVDGSTVIHETQQPFQPSTSMASVSIPAAGEKRKAPAIMKQPNILPPQPSPQLFVIKKEKSLPMPSTESHQPKRQRIENDSVRHPGAAVELLNGISTPNRSPGPQFDPATLRLSPERPQYQPMPTHASTLISGTLPSAQFPSSLALQGHEALLAGTKTPGESSSTHSLSPSLGWSSLSSGDPASSSFMPSKAQQNHHRAHVASMLPSTSAAQNQHSSTSISPMHPLSATLPRYLPVSGPHRRLPSTSSSSLRAGLGPYSPRHTAQQLAGEVRPTTPPVESTSVRPSSKRKPLQKSRKAPQRPTAAQCNETIDLTSDTEQERQHLLSSFKAKALATREQQAATTPLTPPGMSQPLLDMPTQQHDNEDKPSIETLQGFENMRSKTSESTPYEGPQHVSGRPDPVTQQVTMRAYNPYVKFRLETHI
jgi:hypothetical protein